jgi:hypothetical protein
MLYPERDSIIKHSWQVTVSNRRRRVAEYVFAKLESIVAPENQIV